MRVQHILNNPPPRSKPFSRRPIQRRYTAVFINGLNRVCCAELFVPATAQCCQSADFEIFGSDNLAASKNVEQRFASIRITDNPGFRFFGFVNPVAVNFQAVKPGKDLAIMPLGHHPHLYGIVPVFRRSLTVNEIS